MSRWDKNNSVEYMGFNVGRRDVLETVNKENVILFCKYIEILYSYGIEGKKSNYLYMHSIYAIQFLAFIYEKLNDKHISEVTSKDIDEYCYFLSSERSEVCNSIAAQVRAIARFYKLLFSTGAIPYCEVVGAKIKTKSKNVKTNYITDKQVETAKYNLPDNLRMYLEFSLSTAINTNDCLTLKWEQIDLNNRSVKLTNNAYLIFNENVCEQLHNTIAQRKKNKINDYGYVFRSEFRSNDKPITKSTLSRWCTEIGEVIGIDNLRHLDFRHTAIKNMLSASGSAGMTSMVMDYPHLNSRARYFYDENMNKELLAEYKDICEI